MTIAMSAPVLGAVETNIPRSLHDDFRRYFEVVPANTPELLHEAHALRYQVYCVEHPFEDPSEHAAGLEVDAFDGRSVHALIRHRDTGLFAATVRLVLAGSGAAEPFPLESHCAGHLFPGALERLRHTERTHIAEISRFAVSKAFRRRAADSAGTAGSCVGAAYADAMTQPWRGHRRMAPYITLGLFAAVVRMSVEHGITHWLAVMEPTLLRLLARYDIVFPVIGPPVEYHGVRQPTFASMADVVDPARVSCHAVWALVTDRGRYVSPH